MDEGPKVAVVTGGSSGIGLACGRRLVEAGYDVVLTARREHVLREAAESIGARCAVGDSADEDAFARVVANAGRVDLLVHAAGINEGTFVRKETAATFDAVIRTNLRSAFVVSAAVLPSCPPADGSCSCRRPRPTNPTLASRHIQRVESRSQRVCARARSEKWIATASTCTSSRPGPSTRRCSTTCASRCWP